MISAIFKSAQAMRILYFSPPESLLPKSPTWELYPSGISMIQSWIWHFLQISSISSLVALIFPYWRLKKIVSLKRFPFWGTMAILCLKDSNFKSFRFYPSMKTSPWSGSNNQKIMLKRVVFPNPECPTIAFLDPAANFKFKFVNNLSQFLSSFEY